MRFYKCKDYQLLSYQVSLKNKCHLLAVPIKSEGCGGGSLSPPPMGRAGWLQHTLEGSHLWVVGVGGYNILWRGVHHHLWVVGVGGYNILRRGVYHHLWVVGVGGYNILWRGVYHHLWVVGVGGYNILRRGVHHHLWVVGVGGYNILGRGVYHHLWVVGVGGYNILGRGVLSSPMGSRGGWLATTHSGEESTISFG